MAIHPTHKPDPRDVDAAWNEKQARLDELPNRWEKITWAIEHLTAAGDYDRATVETGMSDGELLDIYALEHGQPVAPAQDTDVSPWLWDVPRG